MVAETDAPPKPEDSKGIKGKIMTFVMRRAGSSHPSANRITLLRDTNGDGIADQKTVFLQNLNSPFGMALVGNYLYVANTDSLMRFPYQEGATKITASGTKVLDLPGGPLNHHWTKNVIANREGTKLYITVGSNSNVAENGLDQEKAAHKLWSLILQAVSHVHLQLDCVIQMVWLGNLKAVNSGRWLMSAMKLVVT